MTMLDKFKELDTLRGYIYRLWYYQPSHSTLIIRAVRPDRKHHNVHITFENVYYIQAPLSWDGDFTLGSHLEMAEIVAKTRTKSPADSLREIMSLFRAESSKGVVYILGTLTLIEYDVEPVYD